MHCTKVSEVRKKPVPALGEIRELNFLSLFPRAEKFFPSNSDLGFSFGLTQAIHIHATVLGSGGLGHACVYGAGGAALSTAHEHTHTITCLPHGLCMSGEEEILPELTGCRGE